MKRQTLLILNRFYIITSLIKAKEFRSLFIQIRHSMLLRIKRFVSIVWLTKTSKVAKKIEYFQTLKNFDKVVELYEQNPDTKLSLNTLRIVAVAYMFLEQYDKHTPVLISVLNQSSPFTIDELITHSRRKLDNLHSVVSGFEPPHSLGGTANLGIICHRINNEIKYLTKIKDIKNAINHFEWHFYKNLTKEFPLLNEYSPKMIDYERLPNSDLSLLTMEYIDGEPPTVNHWDKIIEFQSKLFMINYQSNKSKILINNHILPNRHIININYLDTINLIATFFNKKYPTHLIEDDINYLKTIIFRKQHLKNLLNTDNYVLQHRDFNPSNALINKESDNLIVIDWDHIGWDLIGADLIMTLVILEPHLNKIIEMGIMSVEKFVPDSYKEVATHLTLYSLRQKINLINKVPNLDCSIKDWNDAIAFIRGLNDRN